MTEIQQTGGIAVPHFASLDNGDALIAAAIAQFGRIDALINNAGDPLEVDWTTTDQSVWDSMLKSNFKGSYKVHTNILPHCEGT